MPATSTLRFKKRTSGDSLQWRWRDGRTPELRQTFPIVVWLTPKARASVRVVQRIPFVGGDDRVRSRMNAAVGVPVPPRCPDRGASPEMPAVPRRAKRARHRRTVTGLSRSSFPICWLVRPSAARSTMRALSACRTGTDLPRVQCKSSALSRGLSLTGGAARISPRKCSAILTLPMRKYRPNARICFPLYPPSARPSAEGKRGSHHLTRPTSARADPA